MRTLVPGIATAAAILLFSAHGQPPAANGKAAPKGAIEGRLTWFDRQGKMAATSGDSGIYRTLTISPDGKQIAAERTDPQTQNRDIWLIGIANGKTTRFTSNPGWEAFPTWSPD